ncbi:MAG: PCP reductase family protein [Nitrospinota bacterium]
MCCFFLPKIPYFARGMVVKAVEAFARGRGSNKVTPEPPQEIEERWAGEGRCPFAAGS